MSVGVWRQDNEYLKVRVESLRQECGGLAIRVRRFAVESAVV